MAKIIWSSRSLRDLLEIRDYVAIDSPSAARRLMKRLRERTRQLRRFPNSGMLLAVKDQIELREVLYGNYRIIFHPTTNIVEIVAVYHANRLLDLEEL